MPLSFTSPSGITLVRRRRAIDYDTALDGFAERLDRAPGALFSSGVDYPGRYSRWEFGFERPPLEIVGRDKRLTFRALNPRGERIIAQGAAGVRKRGTGQRITFDDRFHLGSCTKAMTLPR